MAVPLACTTVWINEELRKIRKEWKARSNNKYNIGRLVPFHLCNPSETLESVPAQFTKSMANTGYSK